MEIIKIIGVGLIALIIIIILKQYKPEFTVYVSLLARRDYINNVISRIFWNNKFIKKHS